MIEVEAVLDIAAPPMKVWRALSDFASYPRWNPYRGIVGVAALGEKVILQIGPDAAKRRPLPAKITVELLEPVDWSARFGPEAADDEDVVSECYDELVALMQAALDRLAAERRFPVIG